MIVTCDKCGLSEVFEYLTEDEDYNKICDRCGAVLVHYKKKIVTTLCWKCGKSGIFFMRKCPNELELNQKNKWCNCCSECRDDCHNDI